MSDISFDWAPWGLQHQARNVLVPTAHAWHVDIHIAEKTGAGLQFRVQDCDITIDWDVRIWSQVVRIRVKFLIQMWLRSLSAQIQRILWTACLSGRNLHVFYGEICRNCNLQCKCSIQTVLCSQSIVLYVWWARASLTHHDNIMYRLEFRNFASDLCGSLVPSRLLRLGRGC